MFQILFVTVLVGCFGSPFLLPFLVRWIPRDTPKEIVMAFAIGWFVIFFSALFGLGIWGKSLRKVQMVELSSRLGLSFLGDASPAWLAMVILLQIGRLVERIIGNGSFTIVYVLSGLCGSIASMYVHPNTVSVGASGAVFGVYGAVAGFALLQQQSIPPKFSKSLWSSVAWFVGLNLIYGMATPHIDTAAHIGGLIGGFLCGLGLSQPLRIQTRDQRVLRNTLVGIVGAIVIIAGAAMFRPG